MKNLTLMAFILMTVFLLGSGGCASNSGRDVAEDQSEETQVKKKVKKSDYCNKLNPHDPDQYFKEYERCQGY